MVIRGQNSGYLWGKGIGVGQDIYEGVFWGVGNRLYLDSGYINNM